jgi:hypothetical protein
MPLDRGDQWPEGGWFLVFYKVFPEKNLYTLASALSLYHCACLLLPLLPASSVCFICLSCLPRLPCLPFLPPLLPLLPASHGQGRYVAPPGII